MVAVPLSSAVGSPLSAWLITQGHRLLFGLDGWRFMFLVEGLPAIISGSPAGSTSPTGPADANWLHRRRTAVAARGDGCRAGRHRGSIPRLDQAARSPGRIWALAFVYFGIVYGLYAVSFFLPTIIAGFKDEFHTDFSVLQQGFIVAIPFLFGCFSMYFWARHGDRTGERVWHVAIPTIVGGIAIPIALYLEFPVRRHGRGHHLHHGHLRRAADLAAPSTGRTDGRPTSATLTERMFGSGRGGADQQPAVCDAVGGPGRGDDRTQAPADTIAVAAMPTAQPSGRNPRATARRWDR